MARPKKNSQPQTLAELEAKQQQLQAELDALEDQRQQIEQEEIETMIAVVGRAYVTDARKDADKWRQLVADMDQMVRKKAERALFGLPPVPRKPRSKQN